MKHLGAHTLSVYLDVGDQSPSVEKALFIAIAALMDIANQSRGSAAAVAQRELLRLEPHLAAYRHNEQEKLR